ncbi:MAG TPA: hypothetical protein VE932_12710 [Patescibacteria group bacterium]|nr:hypothetical protein [Patescibacteria group bacterium]
MAAENKPKHTHRCPKCRAVEIERSARRGLVERIRLLLARQRPYRCVKCEHRFYDRRA